MARSSPRQNLTTVPEVSEWMRTIWPTSSETYLANVIRRLVRGGLLVSQRGISGGYSFARPPEEITLHDVVALLEGVSYARCALTPTGKCSVQNACSNYATVCDLQQKYTGLLASVTIAQLACDMAAQIPNHNALGASVATQ